jgi:glycosyltransferase involved in cell wall biosynthesis
MKVGFVLLSLICVCCAHRIGLVSIVKDETAILSRLLSSVKPYVDIYLFCDTGSTDGTVEFLENYLENNGLEGFVARHPWYDFGTNRNMCLDEMNNYLPAILRPEYLLLPDADFELLVKDPKWTEKIPYDYNLIAYERSSLSYRQATLINARKDCRYYGVTHEYISCSDVNEQGEAAFTKGHFNGIAFVHHRDGANRIDKFERDERMLKASLEANPSDSRSVFYLAQTLENLGKYDEAIIYYSLRIQAGGWYEEVWFSMYKIGVCKMKRGDSTDSFINDLLEAYDFVPTRSEPLFYLVQAYRNEKKYSLCIMLGLFGNTLHIPKDQHLFIENSIYNWQFKDELSQCLYWKGSYEESKSLMEDLLKDERISDEQKKRISNNLVFSVQKLEEIQNTRTQQQTAQVPPPGKSKTSRQERQPGEQFHKKEL